MFVTTHLVDHVKKVEVDSEAGFAVHRPLRITIAVRKPAMIRKLVTYEPINGKIPRDGEGKRIMGPVRQAMDEAFRVQEANLTDAWYARDTDEMWRIWSAAVEDGIEPAAATKNPQRRRGKAHFAQSKQVSMPVCGDTEGQETERTCTAYGRVMLIVV